MIQISWIGLVKFLASIDSLGFDHINNAYQTSNNFLWISIRGVKFWASFLGDLDEKNHNDLLEAEAFDESFGCFYGLVLETWVNHINGESFKIQQWITVVIQIDSFNYDDFFINQVLNFMLQVYVILSGMSNTSGMVSTMKIGPVKYGIYIDTFWINFSYHSIHLISFKKLGSSFNQRSKGSTTFLQKLMKRKIVIISWRWSYLPLTRRFWWIGVGIWNFWYCGLGSH